MAAPTFQWSESNGSGQTVTDNQTNGVVFASVDQNSNTANLATNDPISAGSNSYEKWWRMKVTGAASNNLSGFGVYYSATAPTDQGGSSSTITMKFGTNATYATPTAATSTVATTNCSTDTSAPGTSFTAPANSVGAYSGYITQQMQTTGSATGGNVNFASPWMTAAYSYS